MEIREMTMDEIEARKAEIKNEFEGASLERLEELDKEIDELDARAKEIGEEAEKRNAIVEKIKNNEGKVIKTMENEIKVERNFTPDTVEYRDAYMKSLQGKPMSLEERSALTSAASVIPTTTVNKIYGLLEENPLIKAVDTLHIPGYLSIPKATAFGDAAWTAMASDASTGTDTVGAVSLTAKKLIKIVEITADIQAMSIDAFEGWLVRKLADKMEAAICAAIVNGNTSATVPEPQGILNASPIASGVTAISSIANVGTIMEKLAAPYHRNASFVMTSHTFFTNILPLASDSNGMLVNDGIQYRLMGHPVILDENCRTGAGTTSSPYKYNVLFGDFRNYVFNFGEGINIEADQSVAFKSGSTVYRAMALCDGAVADPSAFVKAELSA